MTYIPVPTQETGDIWTAANMNIFVRDNFAFGIPGLFEAKGDLAVATLIDQATRLALGTHGEYLQVVSGTSSGLDWLPLISNRVGGHATNWETAGTNTYTPSKVLFQCGAIQWNGVAAPFGTQAVTYPYDFGGTALAFAVGTSDLGGGNLICNVVDSSAGGGCTILWRLLTGTATQLEFLWFAMGIP